MEPRVSVGGIYNIEIMNSALQSGVQHLSFDLRPSSFNFIQGYVLLELLEYIPLRDKVIYLQFEGEADFVINKIVKDVKQVMASRGQLKLIFSDGLSHDYYEQFSLPYYYLVRDKEIDPKIIESKLLEGIILPHSFIQTFDIGEVLKLIGSVKNFDNKRVVQGEVLYDDQQVIDTLGTIPVDILYFTIGPNLEQGYRQVDTDRIKRHLKSLKI